jgi:hypothetical protein
MLLCNALKFRVDMGIDVISLITDNDSGTPFSIQSFLKASHAVYGADV